MIKKAMILSAGYGKRLNPLTLSKPKPLLKIGEETLLSNTVNLLLKLGIKEVVINVHYLAEQIIAYVEKKNFNLTINILNEKNKILDTGGGILNAIKYFKNEPFLTINPDTIWNINHVKEINNMQKGFELNKECKCKMLVVNRKKSFDKNFKGDFSLEKNLIKDNKNIKYVYTGLQLIKPEVFNGIRKKTFPINRIWKKLIKKNELHGSESHIKFLHISTLEVYKNLLNKNFKH